MYSSQPNDAHIAISELKKMGKLLCIITQNIDNLHQKVGLSPKKIYELHGNMGKTVCLDCQHRFTTAAIIVKRKESPTIPPCEICGGMLKPAVVLFGEALPEETLFGSHSLRAGL